MRAWTTELCAPLEASGLFEQERVELVDGALISKMGKTRPHVNTSTLMLEWISNAFGRRFVNAGAPTDVSPEGNPWNEPEPDLARVLKNIGFSTWRAGG